MEGHFDPLLLDCGYFCRHRRVFMILFENTLWNVQILYIFRAIVHLFLQLQGTFMNCTNSLLQKERKAIYL